MIGALLIGSCPEDLKEVEEKPATVFFSLQSVSVVPGEPTEFGKNRTTMASPFSTSQIVYVLLRCMCRIDVRG